MHLRTLQQKQPWVVPHSKEFTQSQTAEGHRDFQHALIHIFKSAGKLAGLIDDWEHGDTLRLTQLELEQRVADMVVCAMRMASKPPHPGFTPFDLEDAVIRRMSSVNNVPIVEEEDNYENLRHQLQVSRDMISNLEAKVVSYETRLKELCSRRLS